MSCFIPARGYGSTKSSFYLHCFLFAALYSVVLSRLKTRAELGDDDGDGMEKKYEEQLTEADVSTLSRAQRRARARQIMKQHRRAVPTAPGANGDEALAIVAAGQQEIQEDDQNHPVLSRKERQRLAKAAEREERKLLEDERKQQQLKAQQEAHQRKLERLQEQARQQEEAKKREQLEKKIAKEAKQEAWETMLRNTETGLRLSVEEWLQQSAQNPIVKLDLLAGEYDVSLDTVSKAIEKLVQEHRVVGVFAGEGTFFVFGNEKLIQLTEWMNKKGEVGADEIADWMNDQVQIASREAPGV